MKKALHITNHVGTIANINNVFNLLGEPEKLCTIKSSLPVHVSSEYADWLWISYEEMISEYDTVIITDTSMYARAFFQNMDKHNLKIIVYVTNRFDWGLFDMHDDDRPIYTDLYSRMSKHPRVYFCADNRYDQYYCLLSDIRFYYGDIIRLTPILRPPTQYIHNKAFVYDRGSPLHCYLNALQDNIIEYDLFGNNYGRFNDMSHISEYKCIFHLPYQTNVQLLWENLGYSNVYLIPSKQFIEHLITTVDWYYWEEKSKNQDILKKSIELAEWYQPELTELFVFFDSWEDLNNKFYNTDFDAKKHTIHNYMVNHNDMYIKKWKHIIDM